MSRPKLPPGQARTERVVVRCTPAELARLEALAARMDTNRSTVARAAWLTMADVTDVNP